MSTPREHLAATVAAWRAELAALPEPQARGARDLDAARAALLHAEAFLASVAALDAIDDGAAAQHRAGTRRLVDRLVRTLAFRMARLERERRRACAEMLAGARGAAEVSGAADAALATVAASTDSETRAGLETSVRGRGDGNGTAGAGRS